MADDIEVTIEEEVIEVEIAETVAITERPPLTALVDDRIFKPSDDGGRFNNAGATKAITGTLPPSSTLRAGWSIELRCIQNVAGRYVTLLAQGSDTIVFDTVETAPAGFLRADALGACLTIELQQGGKFLVTAAIGPWRDT